MRAKAIIQADTIDGLAEALGLPADKLNETILAAAASTQGSQDKFGRDFAGKKPLTAPFFGAKVTGALFHTQGGLEINEKAQVLKANGEPIPNLFAGGGAARGISGSGASGYLAGNGLLTATSLGKIAGREAAALVANNAMN